MGTYSFDTLSLILLSQPTIGFHILGLAGDLGCWRSTIFVGSCPGKDAGWNRLGLLRQVAAAGYDWQAVADHANNLASKIRNNLTNSLKALGVDILTRACMTMGPQKVKIGYEDIVVTAKNKMLTTKLNHAFSNELQNEVLEKSMTTIMRFVPGAAVTPEAVSSSIDKDA